MKKYIRFGELPESGKSTCEDGLLPGISVFRALEIEPGIYTPMMPYPFTQKGFEDFLRFTLHNDGVSKCYLMEGTEVCLDLANNPVIIDPKNIEVIDFDQIFPERRV